MPWRIRNGKRYLYRTRRIGSKFRSEYVGCGAGADAAYAEMQRARGERKRDREARQQVLVDLKALNKAAEQSAKEIELILRAQLLAAGFYQHQRGPWRPRRNTRGK